jgi:hypothetical protein
MLEHLHRGSKLDQIQSKTSRWIFFSPHPESKPCFWLDPARIQSKTPSFGWIRSVLDSDPTALYDKQCIKS